MITVYPTITVATSATSITAIPTVIQPDDRQYDDDGYPYINTNVPGADIATGDKQTQTLNLLSTALPRVVTGTVSIAGTVTTTVSPLAPNAAQETTGQLQRVADLLETMLIEMRVHSSLLSQQSQPLTDDPDSMRDDFIQTIN